jgi:hypothetical protein
MSGQLTVIRDPEFAPEHKAADDLLPILDSFVTEVVTRPG